MPQRVPDPIRWKAPMTATIDHGTYFTLLPREYYLSPEVYEKEIDLVFLRSWHYAGHVSEILNAGNFFTVDVLGESVIISRDREGDIHALLNVCRHRGFPVCREQSGTARAFVCGYHSWSYGLDGNLKKAPSINDGAQIDYADWGLHKVRLEVWRGLIFICLGEPRSTSVAAELEAVAGDFVRLDPEHIRKIHEESYDIDANWKVLLENYQECYHCTGTHPELCVTMDLEEMYRETGSSRPVAEFYGGGTPKKPGVVSLSIDGQPVSKRFLGEFGQGAEMPAGFHAGFAIQPMLSRGDFSVDHGVIHTLRPLGPDRVRWTTRWFVHQDAVEGEDYELDKLTAVWQATNHEDLTLVTGAFKGVKSRRFVPGPLSSDREPALKQTMSLYLKMMGDDIGAAHAT